MAVVVLVGAVVIVSLIGLTINNRTNSKNFQKGAGTSSQPAENVGNNAKTETPSALAQTESVKLSSEEVPPAASAPAPKQVVPAATPKSVQATPPSSSTAFTDANCTGDTIAYVSNKTGAPVSYLYPDRWSTVKVYAFGEQISVYCKLSDGTNYPDYALVNDAYIKKSDLSPTKP